VIDAPSNSKPAQGEYYLDRDSLQTEVIDYRDGKFVTGPADVRRQAVSRMGCLKFPSSQRRR